MRRKEPKAVNNNASPNTEEIDERLSAFPSHLLAISHRVVSDFAASHRLTIHHCIAGISRLQVISMSSSRCRIVGYGSDAPPRPYRPETDGRFGARTTAN